MTTNEESDVVRVGTLAIPTTIVLEGENAIWQYILTEGGGNHRAPYGAPITRADMLTALTADAVEWQKIAAWAWYAGKPFIFARATDHVRNINAQATAMFKDDVWDDMISHG